MLLLIALLIIAIALFGVGFAAVHALIWVAAVVALIWLIALFAGGIGRTGARRW
jgi:hypothetical protein